MPTLPAVGEQGGVRPYPYPVHLAAGTDSHTLHPPWPPTTVSAQREDEAGNGQRQSKQVPRCIAAPDRSVGSLRWLDEPDAGTTSALCGQGDVVTANEGDTLDGDCYSKESRVAALTLDPRSIRTGARCSPTGRLDASPVTTTSLKEASGYTERHEQCPVALGS